MTLIEISEALTLPEHFTKAFIRTAEALINNADAMKMTHLCLFGSVARGDFNFGSDLDFLVITNSESSRAVSRYVESLDLRDDIARPNIDIIVRTRNELSDMDIYFNREVLNDAIILWEGSALNAAPEEN